MNTNIRNLKTEGHQELRAANREWSDCVAKNFLPQWLSGAKINVEEVCASEKTRLESAGEAVYGDAGLPFKAFELPSAPM